MDVLNGWLSYPNDKPCHVCGEPQMIVHVYYDRHITMPRNCLCKRNQLVKIEHENKILELSIEKERKINRFLKTGLLREQIDWTFSNCTKRDYAYKGCLTYAEDSEKNMKNGYGIYLYGKCGVGKTYLSVCIANHLFLMYEVYYTTFPRLLDDIFSYDKRELIIEKCINADFLFVDDFLVLKLSDHQYKNILRIFDTRTILRRPMVLTSNVLYRKGNVDDDRILDRIYSSCFKLEVLGINYRKPVN